MFPGQIAFNSFKLTMFFLISSFFRIQDFYYLWVRKKRPDLKFLINTHH